MSKKAEVELGYRKVPTSALEPNPWNPNKMQGSLFAKLVKNLEQTLKKNKRIPPVVVRPHPTDKSKLQIIDGFHRYKAFKNLKQADIDVFVMDVDDEAAKLLTANLNYLRGDKDPEKYTTLLSDLMEKGMSIDNLSELLPEDEADISDLITTYGDGEAIRRLIEQQDANEAREKGDGGMKDDSMFVEMSFNVSVAQAKVIQREIDRIRKALHGNNLEGRALEYMAVQSSQTELPPELDVPTAPSEAKKAEAKTDAKSKAKERLKRMKVSA